MAEMNEKKMDEKKQKRVPIRTRVLYIVLTTTLISLMAASITGIVCMGWIRSSTENALTEQLESNLKSIVKQKAVSTDAKLEHYEKYILLSTDYIENMYKDRDDMIGRGRIFDPPRNTREYALTRAFANEKLTEEDLEDEILFFSNIEQLWDPIGHENDGLITTIYAGTKSGLLTSYDKWSYLSVKPEGEELIYDYTESGWYTQGLKENKIFYTGLYIDSQGRGLTITVASPFKEAKGKVAGVVAADFDITELYNDMLSFDLGEGSFSFTLDKDGSLISPDAANTTVEKFTGLSKKEIQELLADPNQIIIKNDSLYISVPIERVGWTLCACVPVKLIEASLQEANVSIRYATGIFMAVAIIILILSVVAANSAAHNIIHPMELLGEDMKIIANGDLKHRAKVYRNDEIGDITIRLNDLVDRLTSTMDELISARKKADTMSKLATRDSLTGIRNKTSYEAEARELDRKISEGRAEFGLAMIDMNNLKSINDNYGHNNGDVSIKKLSKMICDTFIHSPVFRIGGDEFVVILENEDYRNIEKLSDKFKAMVEKETSDDGIDPWKRISAAIGYALYDDTLDENVRSVLARADREMYKCKRTMELWDGR